MRLVLPPSMLLLGVSVAGAWAPDILFVKTPPVGENVRLTADELRQLYHLDDQAASAVAAPTSVRHEPYTVQDRAQLWHLPNVPPPAPSFGNHKSFTFEETAEFFGLPEMRRELGRRKNHDSAVPPRLSSQDYASMWRLTEQEKIKTTTTLQDHAPFTDTDRKQMWRINDAKSKTRRPRKTLQLLSNQDRAQLWHLNDAINKKTMEHKGVPHDSYSETDRQLLWDLEAQGQTLQDETRHQIYTDTDRSQLWHLDNDLAPATAPQEDETEAYTADDRANLWNLDEYGLPQDEYASSPFTARDRQELWNL